MLNVDTQVHRTGTTRHALELLRADRGLDPTEPSGIGSPVTTQSRPS